MYVAGEPQNERDFLLNAVRDPERRARLLVDLRPAEAVEAGALAGTFDIVLDTA
jgi:protocatechuate 3,4-dioxygenase beta subunit